MDASGPVGLGVTVAAWQSIELGSVSEGQVVSSLDGRRVVETPRTEKGGQAPAASQAT